MKISIIGSNEKAANFIDNCEKVDNYLEADLVIFSGNINWRSAVTKFNKITSNQKVLALGKCCNFINKRFGIRTIDAGMCYKPETSRIILPMQCLFVEGIVDLDKCPILNEHCDIFASKDYGDFRLGHIDDYRDADFIRMNNVPLIYRINSKNHPVCICAQINPNVLPNSTISKYLNKIICE